MATWEDVRRIALGMPEAEETTGRGGTAHWRVKTKTFAWERPLRKADLAALGGAAPAGPILGIHVADLGIKEALIADRSGIIFTTPHFDGYASVLVDLERATVPVLEELLVDAWLHRAPTRLAKEYLAGEGHPRVR